MSLFNLLASIYLLIQIKVKLEARYFIPMFLASLVGIPFGVYALQHFNETLLRFLVGLVIVVFSLLLYFGNNKEPRLKSKPIVFAGFISGLLGSSVSLSGPPIALAMNRKKYTKDLFRSLFAVFGVLSSFFTLVGYALEGIVLAASVKFTAFLFPLLMVGSKLGDRWARNLKQDKFRKIVIALNFFTGVAVIVTILVKTL
jgi:hypothetical protein